MNTWVENEDTLPAMRSPIWENEESESSQPRTIKRSSLVVHHGEIFKCMGREHPQPPTPSDTPGSPHSKKQTPSPSHGQPRNPEPENKSIHSEICSPVLGKKPTRPEPHRADGPSKDLPDGAAIQSATKNLGNKTPPRPTTSDTPGSPHSKKRTPSPSHRQPKNPRPENKSTHP